ncbi:MAG: hypothetical protein JWQ45_1496 [Blastococcus sp.]|jgi:hypothetical protein|nr:hypothetical protein [Blastococcus sp.]
MFEAHGPTVPPARTPPGTMRPRPAVPPTAAAAAKPCVCGHGRQAHQHYRRGKDCALCSCARYQRRLMGRWRR